MPGGSPSPTILPIDTRQTGWEAIIDQNFQNMLTWLRDQPTQIKRLYHDSSLQPTSGANSYPQTLVLKDYPPANYKGHMAFVQDASSVSGWSSLGNPAVDNLIISDGTDWLWLNDGSALPAAV